MYVLVTAGENQVFSVALLIMFFIALLEGTAMLLGMGVFAFLDSLLPDLDLDADVDTTVDLDAAGSPSAFSRVLGWLHIGRVPILILLVTFLTSFGLIGLSMQSVVKGVTGSYLPGAIAWVPALLCTLPIVRVFGSLLALVIPKDESDAVPEASFIGRVAVVTLGTASVGSPAQAKLRDEHGQSHYVMVQPFESSQVFEQGSTVLLTQQNGSIFSAIPATSDLLVD